MRLRSRSFLGITAFAALLLLTSSQAFAQGQITTQTTISDDDDHQGIGIGIKGGPLFSSFNSDIADHPLDSRTGWIGGLFIGGNRPGVVGVAVDLLFARKKVGTPDGDVTLDYLDIPVLLRVNAGSSSLGGVNVFGVIGPDFQLRLKGKLNFDESIDDQTAGADVGIAAGAGIEITRFIVEGRYTRGFRSLAKDLSADQKITTQSFSVMFGVRFN